MAVNPDTMLANSACVFSCVPDGMQLPALISQFAGIAGVGTDDAGIQQMLTNAVCVNSCIPAGLQLAVLIEQFSQIAGITPPTPVCSNLVPNGLTYDGLGIAQVNGAFNGNYEIIWGVNDAAINVQGNFIPTTGPGTISMFTANNATFVGLSGSGNATVTDIICSV